MHPQNGDIGGCVASCVASEDYTIDQLRTLGGPDHISCWVTSPMSIPDYNHYQSQEKPINLLMITAHS